MFANEFLQQRKQSREMVLPVKPLAAQDKTDISRHSSTTVSTIAEILQRKTSMAQALAKTAEGLYNSFEMLHQTTPSDLIFDLFKASNKEEVNIGKLIKVLKSFGLREKDPRLREMIARKKKFEEESEDGDRGISEMSRHQFKYCIAHSVPLISTALRNQLIIPSWAEFCNNITEIFEECRDVKNGEVAKYIPQLARQNPNLWGMSICTIDGQRFSLGDSKANFCIQSVSKAFNYSIVASDLGTDVVHSYIGHEPSGRLFNDICLDSSGKPHNPMINAGAIITTSLIKSGMNMADRFDFVLHQYRKLSGGEHVGFDNATFLSERDTADRNYALSYYMKENNCFPPNTKSLREELDLYFQLCSLEANCDTLSVMAATLANGGVCPLTDERCVAPQPCRDVLSLMYSCGMYDLSGKFAFQVGLPAKSGVSGVMIVVVPNLMGIALFAPPLDKMGNSCKGVAFCKNLIEKFNFHNYDSLLHTDSHKIDPRRRLCDRDTELIVSLLFAAKSGDMETVRRMFLQGTSLEIADYDGRTALHIAASEGHANLVKFFLSVAKVNPAPRDRWDRTPLEDARMFNHQNCVELLQAPVHHLKSLANINESSTESESDSESDASTTITGLKLPKSPGEAYNRVSMPGESSPVTEFLNGPQL